jgi:hypothetical protein
VNWKFLQEQDSGLEVPTGTGWWMGSSYRNRMVDWKFLQEQDSELEVPTGRTIYFLI